MLTISQLARRFGLSRSTLLYYDSIGLLSPSGRSESNYRIYTETEVRRLELIDIYRRAGLPLADITRVLETDESVLAELLEKRLRSLNEEIRKLRQQQSRIIGLLKDQISLRETRCLDKAGWIAILRASGMNDGEMERWHVEFERLAPEAHQDFLESLGLGTEEIARIRDWSMSKGSTG